MKYVTYTKQVIPFENVSCERYVNGYSFTRIKFEKNLPGEPRRILVKLAHSFKYCLDEGLDFWLLA